MQGTAKLALALALAGLTATAPAGARADYAGPVVAHGIAPDGVPWSVRARRDGRSSIDADFSYAPPAAGDTGFGEQIPYPVPRGLLFTATTGSTFDGSSYEDIAGLAERRVVTLVATMSDGSTLRIRPRLAEHRAYVRHPWLRHIRFYDEFYKAGLKPRRITALDADGRVLGRR